MQGDNSLGSLHMLHLIVHPSICPCVTPKLFYIWPQISTRMIRKIIALHKRQLIEFIVLPRSEKKELDMFYFGFVCFISFYIFATNCPAGCRTVKPKAFIFNPHRVVKKLPLNLVVQSPLEPQALFWFNNFWRSLSIQVEWRVTFLRHPCGSRNMDPTKLDEG